MLSHLIGQFHDLSRRLADAVRNEDEPTVLQIDHDIVELEREILVCRAADRRDIDRQIRFFSDLIVRHSPDPDSVLKYSAMLTALFNRYFDAEPAEHAAPVQRSRKLSRGYDTSVAELVLDSLPERAAVVGLDYKYIYTNERNAAFHDLAPSCFIGRHIVDVIGEERFASRVKAKLDQCFSGASLSYNYELVDAGGRKFDVACRMTPFLGPDGAICGALMLLSMQPLFVDAS